MLGTGRAALVKPLTLHLVSASLNDPLFGVTLEYEQNFPLSEAPTLVSTTVSGQSRGHHTNASDLTGAACPTLVCPQ